MPIPFSMKKDTVHFDKYLFIKAFLQPCGQLQKLKM
jgi:hypothetical protein